jgi:hypothetical protein
MLLGLNVARGKLLGSTGNTHRSLRVLLVLFAPSHAFLLLPHLLRLYKQDIKAPRTSNIHRGQIWLFHCHGTFLSSQVVLYTRTIRREGF